MKYSISFAHSVVPSWSGCECRGSNLERLIPRVRLSIHPGRSRRRDGRGAEPGYPGDSVGDDKQ